jgi:hypothetical protein
VLVTGVVGLAGCGGSEDSAGGGLSLADKAKTVKVCVDVAGSLQSAADVGGQIAHGSITQAEAATQLEPIAAKVTVLANDNAALPIGENLQKLSEDITALQKATPNTPTDLQAAAEALATRTKLVLADCKNVGK